MVSCEIKRIFPKPDDFTIRLGSSNETATVKENTDGSYKYIADIRKTLNMEDHNQNVTCEVTTKIEDSTVPQVTQTLQVECKYVISIYPQSILNLWI